MGYIVVVAEKPSVGRDIARVLGCSVKGDGCLRGEHYIVTWAVGHLVTLSDPDEIDIQYKKWDFSTLPILPEKIPLKVIPQTRDQFRKISQLINAEDTDSLICATDAGREGELIFRYIYRQSQCTKPFNRLWISSMTDEAISEGFRNIRPGKDYDGLYRSAVCRSEADWLVGMNASRAFTLRYNVLLSVGRVQTPTLAILVKRAREIRDFKPESFCTLTADFGDYKGMLFSSKLDPDTHIPYRKDAERFADMIRGKTAAVTVAETSRKKDLPPQLYDLTSLQRDANRLLGFTAEKTLKLAQSLYETHKALTYPRTDSRYLPPDMIPRVIQTMKLLPDSYQKYVSLALTDNKLSVSKRTIDETKVTDHHAIIPTNRKVNPSSFSPDEQKVYDLVTRRLLTAFSAPCEYDATRIITEVENRTFRTNGRVVLKEGWKEIPPMQDPVRSKKKKKSADEEEEVTLPSLHPGDTRTVKSIEIREDTTKPPSQHTDASLLSSMENAGKELDDETIARQMKGNGIGTPATRAAIIERLLQVGYAKRKGKNIIATEKGEQLITIVPEELSSPELTGRWELALHDITDGKQEPDRFMDGIRKMSTYLVHFAHTNRLQVNFPEDTTRKKWSFKDLVLPVVEGTVCPICHKGAIQISPKAFGCKEKSCSFTLWKDCLVKGGGPEINDKLLTMLLEKHQLQGSTGLIQMDDTQIIFIPNGHQSPSVVRSLLYNHTNKGGVAHGNQKPKSDTGKV